MLSEDGDSRFANLHRSRSIPPFFSKPEAQLFRLPELCPWKQRMGRGPSTPWCHVLSRVASLRSGWRLG